MWSRGRGDQTNGPNEEQAESELDGSSCFTRRDQLGESSFEESVMHAGGEDYGREVVKEPRNLASVCD